MLLVGLLLSSIVVFTDVICLHMNDIDFCHFRMMLLMISMLSIYIKPVSCVFHCYQ